MFAYTTDSLEYLKSFFEGTYGPLRIIDNYNIVGFDENDLDDLVELLKATGAQEIIFIVQSEKIDCDCWLKDFKEHNQPREKNTDNKIDLIDNFIKYKPIQINAKDKGMNLDRKIKKIKEQAAKTKNHLDNIIKLMEAEALKKTAIYYYFYDTGDNTLDTHGRYWLRDCLPSEQNEFTGLKGLMVDGSINRIGKNLTIGQELSPDNCTIINDIFGKDEFGDGGIYPRTRYEIITKEDIKKFIYALRNWKI